MAHVTAETLETKLTSMCLNRDWSKTVSAFMTCVSHVIKDHKEAMNDIYGNVCHIGKLNAALSEHKDVSEHIQTLATQDAVLSRRMSGALSNGQIELVGKG